MNKPTEKEIELFEAGFRCWLAAHRARDEEVRRLREAAAILCQAAEHAVTHGLSTTGSPLLDGVVGVRKALGQSQVAFVREHDERAGVVRPDKERGGEE